MATSSKNTPLIDLFLDQVLDKGIDSSLDQVMPFDQARHGEKWIYLSNPGHGPYGNEHLKSEMTPDGFERAADSRYAEVKFGEPYIVPWRMPYPFGAEPRTGCMRQMVDDLVAAGHCIEAAVHKRAVCLSMANKLNEQIERDFITATTRAWSDSYEHKRDAEEMGGLRAGFLKPSHEIS